MNVNCNKHRKGPFTLSSVSIKWKIFLFLLAFMLILLVVLWLLEVHYLDSFYKYVRTRTAKSVREEVIQILMEEEDAVEEKLDLTAARNNLAIYVADTDGNVHYNAEYIATSRLNTIPKRELDRYYQLAKENGGSARISFQGSHRAFRGPLSGDGVLPQGEMPPDRGVMPKADTTPDRELPPQSDAAPDGGSSPQSDAAPDREAPLQQSDAVPDRELPPQSDATPDRETPSGEDAMQEENDAAFMQNHGLDRAESVIYVTLLEINGEEIIFLLNCMLTPVGATVYTLKIELIFISILMLILSVLLAFLISRQISKSMIRVSDSAKELARGRYDVVFEGRDYKEIAALSDTLNYMAKELGKTEKFRRELIANVSHDLRTPLTMITAYAEAMRDLPGENTPENIQVVIEEAMRLTNLVNDMLDLSKLQAGVLQLNSERYNLTEGICGVRNRYNKLVEQDGYQIRFLYDKEAWIQADVFKMEQVIYNLINNAIHYTGADKTVTVRQSFCEDKVRIEIADSGEGIEEGELPYIWERYYKADKSHKRAIQGTGLGLAIVRHILELHESSYGVESKKGEGSTFWFELKNVSQHLRS